MSKEYHILVLDDVDNDDNSNVNWLGTHTLNLTRAGYKPIPTQYGEEAKRIIKFDKFYEIRAAIIDQILLDPKNQELKQPFQGEDVIKYIKSKRHDDFILVMVTAAPVKQAESKEDVVIIRQDLEEKTGAKIFDKNVLEKNYGMLLEYLSDHIKPKPIITGNVLFIIHADQSMVYYVSSDTQNFLKGLNGFAENLRSDGFETRVLKMENFLNKRKDIKKLSTIKSKEQAFKLFQAVGEQTRLGQNQIFFSKGELKSILKVRNTTPDVKNRLWKICAKIRKVAEIPNKLHEFCEIGISKEYNNSPMPEPEGYEIKFKVINLYHVIQ